MQKSTSPVSRRSVTAGLAWSVPAVVAVSAAPAFAASPKCVYTTSTDPIKYPGNTKIGSVTLKQAYGFQVTITNPTAGRIRLTPRSVVIDFEKKGRYTGAKLLIFDKDPCLGGKPLNGDGNQLVLEPAGTAGSTRTFWIIVEDSGNSANEAGCITATLGVTLTPNSVPVPELCETVEVEDACFSTTPPQSQC